MLTDLPDRGIWRHRAKEKRETFSHGRSIEDCPREIETLQEFGYFEADAVLFGKREGQAIEVEELTGAQVYFAYSYLPHERGSNENRNRSLRRFIPKDQVIETLSNQQLVQINWTLNLRPLKCLNRHTPIDIFLLNLRL